MVIIHNNILILVLKYYFLGTYILRPLHKSTQTHQHGKITPKKDEAISKITKPKKPLKKELDY